MTDNNNIIEEDNNSPVPINIDGNWVGKVIESYNAMSTDKLVINLSIQGKMVEVLLVSGASYNILDGVTSKSLG